PAPAGGTRASGLPSPARRRRGARRGTRRRRVAQHRRTRRARRRPAARAPRTPRARARGSARAAPPRGPPRPGRRPGSVEVALEPVEEAVVLGVRLVVARLVELTEQPALLVGEPARNGDVDEHALVAAAVSLEHRHPATAERLHLPRLGAGFELELHRP